MTDTAKAVSLMILSALAFAVMASFVKLAGDVPIFEKVFFRNLISMFLAYGIVKSRGMRPFGTGKNLKFLFARSIMGFAGVILFFYSINHLYLADSSMLNKLSPFFVTFFAWAFLKERLTKVQVPALIIVFLASMLIIKPGFDLSILPSVAGFIGAMLAGGAYTVVRYLGGREEPSVIVFFFSFFSTLATIPFMLLDFRMPTEIELIFLMGTGVFAALGQFTMTIAYKYAPASEIAIYNYTNILFSAILGWMLWAEVSDWWSITGGIIIVMASVAVYLYNNGYLSFGMKRKKAPERAK
ncbi:MAG: DMT family transporter [Candidatus Kapaibacterium sp.]